MIEQSDLVSANLEEMSRALARADAELIEAFLYSLFTPSEADEIAKRWALVKEIAKGRPQRDIARELGLSLCKITRGSRELKKEDSSFKRLLELAGMDLPELPSKRRGRGAQALPAAAAKPAQAKAAGVRRPRPTGPSRADATRRSPARGERALRPSSP